MFKRFFKKLFGSNRVIPLNLSLNGQEILYNIDKVKKEHNIKIKVEMFFQLMERIIGGDFYVVDPELLEYVVRFNEYRFIFYRDKSNINYCCEYIASHISNCSFYTI